MLAETLQFLIKTLADLFTLVLLLRFYLQMVRMPFKHPLAQFCLSLTNFAVLPARKLIPSIKSYDSATLTLAWLVCLVANVIVLALNPWPYNFAAPQTWLSLVLLSVLDVFKQSLYLLMGAVLVQAVMSWVNPYNAMAPVLDALTRPFLKPLRRFAVGGVDLSPLVLFLLIQVVLMLPVRFIELSLVEQLKLVV
ncbi:YggT family protein [Neisseriaceae bacterium JH1-16]|nr:YggT family protein [Neisseriaceae bacterium JH1-16]